MNRTNENARLPPGADRTASYTENYTPNRDAIKPDLSCRLWVLAYDLEEARARYADRRQLLRQAGVCVLLALLRLAGGRI